MSPSGIVSTKLLMVIDDGNAGFMWHVVKKQADREVYVNGDVVKGVPD